MTYKSVVISSGHAWKVRGASGVLDEVNEARNVVDRLSDELHTRGVTVTVFHDNASTTQNENLNAIVNYHNAQERELDVSVHFNAYEPTDNPMGVEVLYYSQAELAEEVAVAISACGFKDRGAKRRDDLFFLNSTSMPAILIEVCFVDSAADAELYKKKFEELCSAIANVLGGSRPTVLESD
jgi:N-acetylmuramoyl-L-alanine amidase